jgi:hypothetical protein
MVRDTHQNGFKSIASAISLRIISSMTTTIAIAIAD